MGRAGLEPATLGLKVRPGWMQRVVDKRKVLQKAGFRAASNCERVRPTETTRYSNRYSSAG